MTEITELQRKRAENIIWSCAGNYAFTPDFKAYDKAGKADIYWNVIIGAARKHYDYSCFEPLLKTLALYEDAALYEDIFWTAMEPLVYEKELESRPVLECLRPKPERTELEFTPDMTSEEIADKAWDFFDRWYRVKKGKIPRRTPNIPGIRKRNAGSIRQFKGGMLWHPKNIYSFSGGFRSPEEQLSTKLTAEELRCFMEAKFGSPMFSRRQMEEIEKHLCDGNHRGTHLLFTYGDKPPADEIRNGFEALSRQRETAEIIKNREYYAAHSNVYRTEIAKLSENIMNSILLHLEPVQIKSDSGVLNGPLVWRAPLLGDGRIFMKNENDNLGNLSVDVLLDASTSQEGRLQVISSQAFIIAEALSKCSIPCRVMSFCSMTGYTVMRVFREYNRPGDNGRVFEFVSNGCNRDGLAIRAARELISRNTYEHRILIVLSDVKPNDVIKIRSRDDVTGTPYDTVEGLKDTAVEVRNARADGISVMCIFTGEDEDLQSAKMVYGRDFARIRDFSMFARTVGTLIRDQIKNI